LGRMAQMVRLVWSRDAAAARFVESTLRGAQRGVLAWMAPYLEGSFDAQALGRRMLEVCYQGELRPEAGNRAEQIFRAQSSHFERALTPVLESAVGEGVVEAFIDGYRLAEPASPAER